jgi:hypothetical protein
MRYKLLVLIFIISAGCTERKTFQIEDIEAPSIKNGAQPYLQISKSGLFLSWQESNNGKNSLKYSRLSKNGWSDPVELASGTNWFINWADFPSLAINQEGQLLSHYLPKSGESTYAYDINVVMTNGDKSFKLHDDTTQTEHGFVSSTALKDNKFLITWLDGRNTTMDEHHHGGAMNLRAVILSSSGEKENEWLLDEKVCDCCQTSTTLTSSGPVIVYRDRSDNEIRDIAYTRYINGSWTSPEKIADDQWQINGCPVNGPQVTSSDNNIAVAWYSGKNPGVYLATSNDGGNSFSKPLVVDNESTIGRVDLVIDEDENIWVSYISTDNKDAVLKVAQFSKKGKILTKTSIASLETSRKSGFPQMEIFDEDIYFAWTNAQDPKGITIKRLNIH